MPHHRTRRHAERQAQRAHRLCVGAAMLTVAALSNAATTAPAMQQAQPAFGATPDSAAPKPLALTPPSPAPAGLARPATTVDLKAPHAALPAASNSLGTGALATKANQSSKKLFDMDDRAIIIVSGKQTTAGEVKKSVLAELAKKDGPPRTVKGGARKLDLAALNVTHSATGAVPTLSTRTLNAPLDPGTQVNITPEPSTKGTFAQRVNRNSALIKEITCADKGRPAISEIKGKLKAAGGAFTVEGRCFGDRAGRLTVSGKFGTVDAVVTAWDMNSITARLPAGIQGVPDHRVDVSIASTEFSKPFSADFVAQRTRIDVPERLWIGNYPIYSTTHFAPKDGSDPAFRHPHESGSTRLLVRVNEACALDTVDFKVSAGTISAFSGWEQGPAYQGNLTVDWIPSCKQFEATETGLFKVEWSGSRVCRVLIEPRATAYCPLGVSPDPVSLKAQGAPARLR
jgi:hypothetical protein